MRTGRCDYHAGYANVLRKPQNALSGVKRKLPQVRLLMVLHRDPWFSVL